MPRACTPTRIGHSIQHRKALTHLGSRPTPRTTDRSSRFRPITNPSTTMARLLASVVLGLLVRTYAPSPHPRACAQLPPRSESGFDIELAHASQAAAATTASAEMCHLYSTTIESPCFTLEKNATNYQIRQYHAGEVNKTTVVDNRTHTYTQTILASTDTPIPTNHSTGPTPTWTPVSLRTPRTRAS